MNIAPATLKTIGWHVGSMLAGAYAMIVFASSHSVDLYAIFDQMQEIYSLIVKLGGSLAPFIAAGAAGYRMWNMKAVPQSSVAVMPVMPPDAMSGTIGAHAVVTGKIVG